MRLIGFNPFRLLDLVEWITGFRELLDRFAGTDGTAPPLEIEVSGDAGAGTRGAGHDDASVSEQEVKDLSKLTAAARDLVARKETVDVEACPSDALLWFKIAFDLARPEDAAYCSFDTAFDRFDPPRGRFWAVARQTVGQGTNIRYYLGEKRLVVKTILPDLDGTVWRWMTYELATGADGDALRRGVAQVQRLAGSLTERGTSQDIDAEVVRAFVAANDEELRRRALANFADCLGPALASWWIPVWEATATPEDRIAKAGAEPPGARLICDEIAEHIVQNVPRLPRGSWARLQNLARRAGHPLLAFLAGNFRPLALRRPASALANLDEKDFARALRVIKLVGVSSFIGEATREILPRHPAVVAFDDEQIAEMVERYARAGWLNSLVPLTERVCALQGRWRRRAGLAVARAIDKAPEGLRALLDDGRSPVSTALNWLFRLVPGRSRPARSASKTHDAPKSSKTRTIGRLLS